MGSFNLNIWRKIPLKISAKSDKQTKPQSATYLSIIDEIDREDEDPDATVDFKINIKIIGAANFPHRRHLGGGAQC